MPNKRVFSQKALSFGITAFGIINGLSALAGRIFSAMPDWLTALFGLVAVVALALGLLIFLSESIFNWFVYHILHGKPRSIKRGENKHCEAVHSLAREYFGDQVTSPDQICGIIKKYRNALIICLSERKSGPETIETQRVLVGYFMAFPISKSCVEKIHDFSFDASDIKDADIITNPHQAHAMYIGGIVGKGIGTRYELIGALKIYLGEAVKTRTQTIYARAATGAGLRILVKHGFEPVHPNAPGLNNFYKRAVR